VIAAGVTACASVLGVEEITVDEAPSSTEGGAGADAGSDGDDRDTRVPDIAPDAAPPLNCPLGCLPPAPPGWTGPSAVFDDVVTAKPNACPPLYTVREVDAFHGLQATAAVCSCGQAAFAGANCTVTRECSDADCSVAGDVDVIDIKATPCVATGVGAGCVIGGPVIMRGTCSYPSPTSTVAPVTFDKVNLACGLPQNASCQNRADCVAAPIPEAPFTRLCLHAPGDVSCPSFDYAARLVTFERVVDDRACKFAGCTGATAGGACGTKFAISTSAQCAAAAAANNTLGFGACNAAGTGNVFNLRALAPTGITCSAGAATAAGGAISDGAVTFCCTR
jgi:hypothetical protein